MKIRCDVCDKAEAAVFCSADEAALCDGCDRRVHHANKLASKHLRFSLLHPTSKEAPLCDICQERKAFLFCQEDRAILCRECDLQIHKANEYTQKHNRFLLTGVKLSASSTSYPSNRCNRKPSSASNNDAFSSPLVETERTSTSGGYSVDDTQFSDNGSISTSSISEYLEQVPGWRVDEFLDPFFANNGVSSKTALHHFLPLVDQDLENITGFFSTAEKVSELPYQMGLQVLPLSAPQCTGLSDGSKDMKVAKMNQKWRSDDCFTVPQISPPFLKKPRHFS